MGIEIKENIEEYKKYLKKNVNRKRYIHSLNVSIIATALAMRYGADIDSAETAGLLHDCAKGLSKDELLKECKTANIKISDYEVQNKELLHSKVGAYIIQKEFGIKDIDIINSIANHTVGRPNMSILEKIIFVADYIEPARTNIPGLAEIRSLAFDDIDKAIVHIYENTIFYLTKENRIIDSSTYESLKYYKNQCND